MKKGICCLCKKEKSLKNKDTNGRRICGCCYEKHIRPKKICSFCNKLKPPAANTLSGPCCKKCYHKFAQPKQICKICKTEQIANVKEEDGIICINCYKCPKDVCSVCNKKKHVYTRKNDKAICQSCYVRPKELCKYCNNFKIVETRENSKPVCGSCRIKHIKNKEFCQFCNSFGPVQKNNASGKIICKNCYAKHFQPTKICCICNKERKIHTLYKNNPTCRSCYSTIKRDLDESFRISALLRTRLWTAFKEYSTTGKIKKSDEYGINYLKIIKKLGNCPGNREEYHIDHIFPLSAFNFDNKIEVKIAFSPENHQWLKKEDNIVKKDKYEKSDFDNFCMYIINKYKLEK